MVVLILYYVTPNMTKLSLFESFALPVIMYGLDVLFLGPVEMRKLNAVSYTHLTLPTILRV